MHRKTPHPDQEHYWQFTGPMRADKAIHLLEGLVRGITIDHKVNGTELSSLTAWVYEHQEFEDHYPFSQVIPLLREILCDGIVGEEEIAELLWHCNEISTDNVFYSKVTSDMQRLFGVLQGIAADGKITDDEIEGLQEYLETAKHLEGHWPYTEINTLITNIYKDRFIFWCSFIF